MNMIIFSKDRPAQLELLLRSIRDYLIYKNFFCISILYKATNSEYEEGYKIVKQTYPEYFYLDENKTGFKQGTMLLIDKDRSYTTFLVDDDVFKVPFSITMLEFQKFVLDPSVLCFSLRMHRGINFCYTRNEDTPAPKDFVDGCKWDWTDPVLKEDWNYPMSLDGHIFRTEDILPLILQVNNMVNPNYLEGGLDQLKRKDKPYMICLGENSPIMNIPANRVQDFARNRHGNYSQKDINDRFLKKQIISIKNIAGIKNTAPHQEVSLEFEGLL